MQKIITDDGSVTFRSDKVDECYHTKSGAVEEAFEKHVYPSNIKELAKNNKIVIFDICFGLGYNSAAAIDTIKEINKNCEILIYALENDQEILDKILEIEPNFKSFNYIKYIVKTHFIDKDNIKIKILFGDAKERIKEINDLADAVFFDPFSPKIAPEMWGLEFFKDINNKMKKDRVLTTYSCARIVRDNLKGAGFLVYDGPKIGRRSPSTIAIKA